LNSLTVLNGMFIEWLLNELVEVEQIDLLVMWRLLFLHLFSIHFQWIQMPLSYGGGNIAGVGILNTCTGGGTSEENFC
jgi:hypothetical protein